MVIPTKSLFDPSFLITKLRKMNSDWKEGSESIPFRYTKHDMRLYLIGWNRMERNEIISIKWNGNFYSLA